MARKQSPARTYRRGEDVMVEIAPGIAVNLEAGRRLGLIVGEI